MSAVRPRLSSRYQRRPAASGVVTSLCPLTAGLSLSCGSEWNRRIDVRPFRQPSKSGSPRIPRIDDGRAADEVVERATLALDDHPYRCDHEEQHAEIEQQGPDHSLAARDNSTVL